LTASKGAEVLFYPTTMDGIQEKRMNMGKPIRCLDVDEKGRTFIANGVYVAAANRIGLTIFT
jgi:predicted amidohydrolase